MSEPAAGDDVHAARRARVLAQLGDGDALVVAASPELTVGADTDVRYLPDPDLFYLTGCVEPECVAVLCPSAPQPFTLFVRPRNPERERWSGVRGGVEAARRIAGDDAAHPIEELAARLPSLLAGASRIHLPFSTLRADVDAAVKSAVAQGSRSRTRTGRGAHALLDSRVLLGALRLIKDGGELDLLRTAARITVESFRDMASALPRMTHEFHAESAVEHGFRTRGAMGPAFPTIAASGANATVLHYTVNDRAFGAADLVLVDAGARYGMYCGDVSRTYPVRGRFSAPQRAAYDVVLAAHRAALSCVAPGRSVDDLENAALRVLTQGMLDLGLLTGDLEAVLEAKAYRRYFPHRVSHWLGLDVHDAGDYSAEGRGVGLKPGMVLTIEPGLYVPHDDEAAPEALRGLGIRLEDDVHVTAAGAEVLTGDLAIEADDVEALMR